MGATSRESGSVYTTIFLAGCLLALVIVALAGGAFASLTGRNRASRVSVAFALAAPVAAGLAYAVVPPYRSPEAPAIHEGVVNVHLDSPEALEWRADAECRVEHLASAASTIWAPDVRVDDRWAAVLVGLDAAQTVTRVTIAFSSPAGGADYIATRGSGIGSAGVSPDGLHARVQLTAARVPMSGRPSPAADDRIAGAVDWDCR